jgi:hypothetical protein
MLPMLVVAAKAWQQQCIGAAPVVYVPAIPRGLSRPCHTLDHQQVRPVIVIVTIPTHWFGGARVTNDTEVP